MRKSVILGFALVIVLSFSLMIGMPVLAIAAPTATTGSAGSITISGAGLSGTVNDNGANTTVSFEYGTTTGYGNSVTATQSPVPAGTGPTTVTATIGSLSHGTTYHYRVDATNSAGTTNGNDMNFTTLGPSATTGTADSITTGGATLHGNVNANDAPTAVSFDYGLTSSYGPQ